MEAEQSKVLSTDCPSDKPAIECRFQTKSVHKLRPNSYPITNGAISLKRVHGHQNHCKTIEPALGSHLKGPVITESSRNFAADHEEKTLTSSDGKQFIRSDNPVETSKSNDRKQTTQIVENSCQATSAEPRIVTENSPKSTPGCEKSTLKVPPCPRYDLGFLNDLQSKYKFSTAVSKQNEVATTAIQSLDCLNDQIVQYIVSSQTSGNLDDKTSNESVQSSMVLIRRLLLDAQSRFRKMVEDNKQLASHIDTSIQAANQEVNMLRAELASTNKRLSQISAQEEIGKKDKATQVEKSRTSGSLKSHEKSKSDKEDLETTIQTLTQENSQLVEDYKHLIEEHDALKCAHEELKQVSEKLKMENTRLDGELCTLKKDCDDLKQVKSEGATSEHKLSYGELKLELIQTRQELNRAKEVLQGMKSDRKRLKGEKLDLLSQMKQLYTTLEEKETELRDFIHNYEQRVKESDDMIKQLAKEKEDLEHEKWDIVTKAKDATERAMFLKAQLDTKEHSIKEIESELKETKEKLSSHDSVKQSVTSTTTTASDGNVDDDVFAVLNDHGFSTAEESSVLNSTFTQEKEVISCSPVSTTESTDPTSSMFRWFTQSSDFEFPLETKPNKKKKIRSFGSLSRVFSRGKVRRSIALPHAESLIADDGSPKLCVLSQDNYQEKLNTIEKMVGLDMKEWRAHQVLAWLEITLAMPMYAQNCLLNVKSGKILLGLSDSELSAALSVTNTMHKRKLRLAIEQHRNPDEIKYLKASEMDPTWISHRFLPELGLPQYTDIFEEQLCDGHVLNTLTRRDLEKHFSVHRKFHQSSIIHAVELLRRIDFNKEKLYHRRNLSEEKDIDLIVWTNERLMKWTRSIDLGEYCDSLMESGVHGALMVLEPSFNADSLAAILGIPPSKSYIRRHLSTELDKILKPARAALDTADSKENGSFIKNKSRKGSQDKVQKTFEDRGRRKSEEEGRSKLSFRGSLGRAFGKKVRDDIKTNFDSESSRTKISAPIPIQHSSLSSLTSDSELLRKGFCLKNSQQRHLSYGSQGDPLLNGILAQNLRQKYLARSDQTLHRSFDLHVIREKENGILPNEDFKLGGNSTGSSSVDCLGKDEENGKLSIASSQETLTEQSGSCEKNNNLQNDIVALHNEIIIPQCLPESDSKPLDNSVKMNGLERLSNQNMKTIVLSKNPSDPLNVDQTPKSVIQEENHMTKRASQSSNRSSGDIGLSNQLNSEKEMIPRKCKQSSLSDLLLQTTSV